jgi:co-chaperonin GroES (HSP10)
MAVNITPLHDRVLVRRLEEKESIKGGMAKQIVTGENSRQAILRGVNSSPTQ